MHYHIFLVYYKHGRSDVMSFTSEEALRAYFVKYCEEHEIVKLAIDSTRTRQNLAQVSIQEDDLVGVIQYMLNLGDAVLEEEDGYGITAVVEGGEMHNYITWRT